MNPQIDPVDFSASKVESPKTGATKKWVARSVVAKRVPKVDPELAGPVGKESARLKPLAARSVASDHPAGSPGAHGGRVGEACVSHDEESRSVPTRKRLDGVLPSRDDGSATASDGSDDQRIGASTASPVASQPAARPEPAVPHADVGEPVDTHGALPADGGSEKDHSSVDPVKGHGRDPEVDDGDASSVAESDGGPQEEPVVATDGSPLVALPDDGADAPDDVSSKDTGVVDLPTAATSDDVPATSSPKQVPKKDVTRGIPIVRRLSEGLKTIPWRVKDLRPNKVNSEIFTDSLAEDSIETLAADIDRNGLQQPLSITGRGLIMDGHRRYLALKYLGKRDTDVVVTKATGTDKEVEEHVLSAYSTSRKASPREKAKVFTLAKKVLKRRHGRPQGRQSETSQDCDVQAWDPADIRKEAAKLAGFGSETIARYAVKLFESEYDDVKEAVQKGEMTITAAYEAVKVQQAGHTESSESTISTPAGDDALAVEQGDGDSEVGPESPLNTAPAISDEESTGEEGTTTTESESAEPVNGSEPQQSPPVANNGAAPSAAADGDGDQPSDGEPVGSGSEIGVTSNVPPSHDEPGDADEEEPDEELEAAFSVLLAAAGGTLHADRLREMIEELAGLTGLVIWGENDAPSTQRRRVDAPA